MIGRILLDDDTWRITSGLLGGIKITLKSRSTTIKTNRNERNYLYDILDELKKRGRPIEPGSAELNDIFVLFSEAVFSRGDPRWQAFFQVMSPESIVDGVILNEQANIKFSIQSGLELAKLDAKIKEDAFADGFGCSHCHLLPATGTKFEDLPFKRTKTLHDSSHSSFWLSECKYCKQPFLEGFYDKIDWFGEGKDPMWSHWLPLKQDEYTSIEQGHYIDADYFDTFLRKRTCLELNPENQYSWINASEENT